MKGLEAKKVYNALLNYKDPFKYNFTTRLSEETFKKDPSRWLFAKIEAECDHDKMELVKLIYPSFYFKAWTKRFSLNYFKKYYDEYKTKLVDNQEKLLYNIGSMDDLIKISSINLPEIYIKHQLTEQLSNEEAVLVFYHKRNEIQAIDIDFPAWNKYKEEMQLKAKFFSLYVS